MARPDRSAKLPVDLPDDGGIEGIVNGGSVLSAGAVSGNRGHALLIERPFEKDGLGSLDQPGQRFPETDRGKVGRSHEERHPGRFFPPSRPSSTVFPSRGIGSSTSHNAYSG